MVGFDIDRINAESPYKVEEASRNSLTFVTGKGVNYIIRFRHDDIMLPGTETYEISIINTGKTASPRDPNLRDTIVEILREFFRNNNLPMLYICSTGDGKQASRNRLFAHWFRLYADDGLIYLNKKLIDLENVVNYISLILRKDHPQLQKVLDVWEKEIANLSNKPE